MSNREIALHEWLARQLTSSEGNLVPLCGDASFRRYFRIHCNTRSYIVMDAPPEIEALFPFINAASALQSCAVRVPEIYAVDPVLGFALLEDFGDQLLLNALTTQNADLLYHRAIDDLLRIQSFPLDPKPAFPEFDLAFMQSEMALCIEWFIQRYRNYSLDPTERAMLNHAFHEICSKIIQQPTVLIHRDYHSRNIMWISHEDGVKLGIIDFQDIMTGPYSYDLVSLCKDCYIEWPHEKQLQWLKYYHARSPIHLQRDFDAFVQDYEYCGLQRHLKVLGIFSRLYLRDAKAGYLKDIPLTLNYIINCLERTGLFPEMLRFFQRIADV